LTKKVDFFYNRDERRHKMKKIDMRERREELKLTLEEVAARVGITSSAVRQMEVGAFSGSLFVKLKLADALGKSFNELWPEDFAEMAELEELQKKDRKRAKIITTSDLDSKGKLTPEARKRRLIEGD
jgi:DNA-binding XRE family transcriptional regulator